MSATLVISAVKPPDEIWKKHKAVWDACIAAGVSVPPEIDAFFEGESPNPAGVEVFLSFVNHDSEHEAVTEAEDKWGYTKLVDITKLPKDTRYIQVSYQP